MTACSVEGCDTQARARGMCDTHYHHWRRNHPDQVVRQVHNPGQVCSQDGCGKPAKTRGMCVGCYGKALYHGRIERVQYRGIYDGQACAVTGCDRPVSSKGLCGAHYEKRRRTAVRKCAAYKCDSVELYETTDLCRWHYERHKAGFDIWREQVDPPIIPIARWWQPSQPTPCQTTDPEMWFPEGGENPALARSLCQQCPEILGCRAFAEQIRPSHGVWAGQSWNNRRVRRPA